MGFYGLLYIPNDKDLEQVVSRSFFYSKDAPGSSILDNLENVFEDRLRMQRLQELGVSVSDFESVDNNFEINTATFTGEQNLKGITEMKAFIGGAFGYLIMMFIIIYGGFVMRSVIEEKTTRIIEVIISSVKP